MLSFFTLRENDTADADIERIYHRYKRYVYARTGDYTADRSLREDVAQEAWISVLKNAEKLKQMPQKAQIVYIALTVRSAALDYLARMKHTELPLMEEGGTDQEHSIPSAEEQFFQDHPVSSTGLWAHLSPADQRLLIGRYVQGLSDSELAEQCHVKPDSVRMMLTRARRRAKEYILKEMEADRDGA